MHSLGYLKCMFFIQGITGVFPTQTLLRRAVRHHTTHINSLCLIINGRAPKWHFRMFIQHKRDHLNCVDTTKSTWSTHCNASRQMHYTTDTLACLAGLAPRSHVVARWSVLFTGLWAPKHCLIETVQCKANYHSIIVCDFFSSLKQYIMYYYFDIW